MSLNNLLIVSLVTLVSLTGWETMVEAKIKHRSEWEKLVDLARKNNLTDEQIVFLLALREAENGAGIERKRILDINRDLVYTLSREEILIWKEKYAPTVKESLIYLPFIQMEKDLGVIAKSATELKSKNGIERIEYLLVPEGSDIMKQIEGKYLTAKERSTKGIDKNTLKELENGVKKIHGSNTLLRKNDILKNRGSSKLNSELKEEENVSVADIMKIMQPYIGTIKEKNFSLFQTQEFHQITIEKYLENLPNVSYFVLIVIPKNTILNMIEKKLSLMENFQIELSGNLKDMELVFYEDMGYQFGVKAAKGTTLERQAIWAIGSIRKNDTRWQKFLLEKGEIGFTQFFAYFGGPYNRGWVEHDKEDWIDNVNFFIKEIQNEFTRVD